MPSEKFEPIVELGPEDEPRYGLNPAIVRLARELEEELGRWPTLHETAEAWKARRREARDDG